MATLASPKGTAAMRKYLSELAQSMRAGVAESHDATGALGASIASELTVIGGAGTSGRIIALDYWPNVGSGTPPGTQVDVNSLAKWALAKGIRSTDRGAMLFALRAGPKIEQFGSRDWRRGGANVFLTAIEIAAPEVAGVLGAHMDDLDNATLRLFIENQRAA
jgi:hypothetical protein